MIFNNSSSSKGINWLDKINATSAIQGANLTALGNRVILTGFSGFNGIGNIFQNCTFAPNTELILHKKGGDGNFSLGSFANDSVNLKKITIIFDEPHSLTGSIQEWLSGSSVEELKIINCTDFNPATYTNSRMPNLKTLDVEFNLDRYASGTNVLVGTRIENMYFKPNSCHISNSVFNGKNAFTNASLTSLINALDEFETSKTLTIGSTLKNKANAIQGVVSEMTRDDVTFHFFTENEYGEYTLTEFATDIKGWTLA